MEFFLLLHQGNIKTLNQVNIVKEAFTKIKAFKPANITTKVENLIKKSNKNYKDKKPDKFDKRKIKCFRFNKYGLVVPSIPHKYGLLAIVQKYIYIYMVILPIIVK
jgi:hypothetical protein